MKKTFDEKLFLVKQLKDGAPITRLAREYHVRQPTLLQWARKYDRYGVDGLRPLRRPRMSIPKEIKEETPPRPPKAMRRQKVKISQTEVDQLRS